MDIRELAGLYKGSCELKLSSAYIYDYSFEDQLDYIIDEIRHIYHKRKIEILSEKTGEKFSEFSIKKHFCSFNTNDYDTESENENCDYL